MEQRLARRAAGTLIILRYPGWPIVRIAPPLCVAGAVASVARLPMSFCPVGAAARAPVLVRGTRAGGSSKGTGGMATAAIRRAMPATTRGVAAASSSAAARPSYVVTAGAVRAGSASIAVTRSKVSWGAGAASRGYASNVFKNNNVVAKAVAGAETAVEGEVVAPPIKLLTSDESPELLKIRHTSAHICAMAVQTLFPTAQATIGPW